MNPSAAAELKYSWNWRTYIEMTTRPSAHEIECLFDSPPECPDALGGDLDARDPSSQTPKQLALL